MVVRTITWPKKLYLNSCRFIEPTILVDPPLEAAIMSEEIFGPLLPIITVSFMQHVSQKKNINIVLSYSTCLYYVFLYIFSNLTNEFHFFFLFLPINNLQVEKIEDSIKFINARPKPLALYVFTKNHTLQRRMISETSSGSVTINDAVLQVIPITYI